MKILQTELIVELLSISATVFNWKALLAMSNAELWDLDTSGGIMEQIQMLVAPPVSADALRRSRRRREREVYRRPGRSVNHDCCDSCKEGGDLICCDRCPAAFHLLCHDPPLTEEELPTGEWLCHKCKITPQEAKDDDTESTSSKSSSRSIRNKRVAVQIDADGEMEHPLRTLAKAARLMNPGQFDLGKEISCNKPLPGSSKRVYGKAVRNLPKKQAHELDNGLVPLPAKICFTCNKSCRIAALIQCDYCPLLFHLDCLNPPIASLPTGRWMCPNHVEHFLDAHLLKSQSLTERLRLWDRYTGLVDSHAVKADFLNKIHRKNPMFRFKRKLPSRPTISVPPAIKHFYQHPPVLLPDPARPGPPAKTAADLLGARGVSASTLEEQEEWLSSVVSMQVSVARYLAQKQIQRSTDNVRTTETITVVSKPTASVAPVVQKDSQSTTVSSSLQSELEDKLASSSSSSSSSTVVAFDSSDCDRTKQQFSTSLLNGEQKSSADSATSQTDKIHLGQTRTLDIPFRSGVSLLSNHNTNSNTSNNVNNSSPVNGDVDLMDTHSLVTEIQEDSGSLLTRFRSNSVDSISSPSQMGSRAGWVKEENNANDDGSNNNNGSKNIVINSVNKSNNVGTKSLPGKPQPAKVILPSNKTSILSNNINNVGAVSQRVIVQSSNKAQATSGSSGPTPKVITVSATPSGRSVSVTAGLNKTSNSNINSIIGSSPTIANLNTLLQQWIETNAVDSEFSKIDEQLTHILAWQRLQQLLPAKSPPSSTTFQPTSGSASVSVSSSTTGRKGLLNVYLSQQGSSEVRARAVLCPLSGKGQAIPMPYRSLSLGTGADMDVCLSQYGHCNFISGHHATIFYDEMSRHFELLNYSEHGTTVDNVLYSCDFSDKPATTPQSSPVVSAVREIISKASRNRNSSKSSKVKDDGEEDERPKEKETGEKEKLRMSARANEMCKPCNCKVSSSSLIGGSGAGWEGTALLHHGSYIKVGCLQFVFSIVDHAPDQPIPTTSESSQNPLTSLSLLSSSVPSTTRFSSMPLLSSSQYLHNQPSMSLLKTHLKSAAPP